MKNHLKIESEVAVEGFDRRKDEEGSESWPLWKNCKKGGKLGTREAWWWWSETTLYFRAPSPRTDRNDCIFFSQHLQNDTIFFWIPSQFHLPTQSPLIPPTLPFLFTFAHQLFLPLFPDSDGTSFSHPPRFLFSLSSFWLLFDFTIRDSDLTILFCFMFKLCLLAVKVWQNRRIIWFVKATFFPFGKFLGNHIQVLLGFTIYAISLR